MQSTNHFLRSAFQLGPWRITRKVLLFIIVFCLLVVFFSTLVLKTHMFDEDWEDIDWDDDDWEDNISGGDSMLLIMIAIAGIGAVVAAAGCCMASSNSPQQLSNERSNSAVFTVSSVATDLAAPVAPASAPQMDAGQRPRRHHRRQRGPSEDTIKANPPTSAYPQGPSYPVNPGYPAYPPPYSAPSYPAPPTEAPAPAPAPVHHTISDLPPPYAPGNFTPTSPPR